MKSAVLENYIIYEDGTVYSLWTKKFLKHIKKEYPCVDLYLKDRVKRYFIHRLLAENFIPNTFGKPYVNHIDGNKYNFYIKNLEWVTHQENIRHCWDNGFYRMPERGKKVICTLTGKIYKSVKEAATLLGYNHKTLCNKLNESYIQRNNTTLKYI